MNTQHSSAIAAALLLFSSSASADIDLLFMAGLDVGGDDLAEVYYVGGDSVSVTAGGLLYGAVGGIYQSSEESNMETQFSIGWKFDSAPAVNGGVDFDRYPLELIQFVTSSEYRFGAGLTYHLSPSLSGDGFAASVNTEFDNALGFIIEYDYITPNTKHFIGARITIIEYETPDYISSVNGNSIGVNGGLRF